MACFRVKIKEGAYWFPKKSADNPRIRPISSQDTLQRVKKELQKTVREFDPDRKMWKRRIDEVRAGDDMIANGMETMERIDYIDIFSITFATL